MTINWALFIRLDRIRARQLQDFGQIGSDVKGSTARDLINPRQFPCLFAAASLLGDFRGSDRAEFCRSAWSRVHRRLLDLRFGHQCVSRSIRVLQRKPDQRQDRLGVASLNSISQGTRRCGRPMLVGSARHSVKASLVSYRDARARFNA